jgi:hypothetical protein
MTANETWATAFSVALLTSVEAAKFLNISPTCAESTVGARQINALAEKSSLHFC